MMLRQQINHMKAYDMIYPGQNEVLSIYSVDRGQHEIPHSGHIVKIQSKKSKYFDQNLEVF